MFISREKYWKGITNMRNIGVSSACFYPLETERSFRKLGEMGIKTVEIFYNSTSEISNSFTKEIIELKNYYDMKVVAVHPFMSFAESFFLFSNYKRRFQDILPFYDRFFEITAELGANFFIIHGIKNPGTISNQEYFERFATLSQRGKKAGITVAQENVVYYRSQAPEFMKQMYTHIGDSFKMVLDIKQARRAKISPYAFLDTLAGQIAHIHISDFNSDSDCISPLEGKFNFNKFFYKCFEAGYLGDFIIELYKESYQTETQILGSKSKLDLLLTNYK